MARHARTVDWARTQVGAVIGWPDHMRLVVRTAIDSPHAAATWWGSELIQIYNDAWSEFLGPTKHPNALGAPARSTWVDSWHEMAPLLDRVMLHGEALASEEFLTLIERQDAVEEAYVTFSYLPIRDLSGAVVGVHNTAWNSTRNVVAERRMRVLRDLTTRMRRGA